MADFEESTFDLHGSMDPALLPDITTTYESSAAHLQKQDGTVGSPDNEAAVDTTITATPTPATNKRYSLVEKASSGRMSPIRKKSVKDVEKQIEGLEKENFDLKLRIYFLEQQKGVNRDDTLKVNIDLKVQLQSIHQEFQNKQAQWEKMMASYEEHITELEKEVNRHQSSDSSREVNELREQLADAKHHIIDMESQINERAFESEAQVQQLHTELEAVRKQLADRERQIMASPSQDEVLQLKKSLDEQAAELNDKNHLLKAVHNQVSDLQSQLRQLNEKMASLEQALNERDNDLADRESELSDKDSELRSALAELHQKDATLRTAQVTLESLQASVTANEADIEKHKAQLNEQYNTELREMMSKLETSQRALSHKDAILLTKDKELSAERREIHARDNIISELRDQINDHKKEIQALMRNAEADKNRYWESINQLRATLAERDQLIEMLQNTIKQQQQTQENLLPLQSSTPRDENAAISHMCNEVERLKKECAALREGRQLSYHDDDIDIDSLSETSEHRDYLHSELARHNARASAIQSKLLELSHEDTDAGGSEASSILKEQVAALMRMREADKKVIDALTKHITHNSGGQFNGQVVADLAYDVSRLREKLKEEKRKRGSRSTAGGTSSRSARSGHSSSGSSVYREELEHLRTELDNSRHEAAKYKSELARLRDELAAFSSLQGTRAPDAESAALAATRVSKIPRRRSSSAPRSSEERKLSSESFLTPRGKGHPDADSSSLSELEGHLAGAVYRKQNFTPENINRVMKQLGQETHSTEMKGVAADSPQLQELREENQRLQDQVDQFKTEMMALGRPAELKKQLDEMKNELLVAQEKLNESVEDSHQMEASYQKELAEKEEYIEELLDTIRRLQAQIKGLDLEEGLADQTGSVSLNMSRPPSSLHSVAGERASSRVVSLQDKHNQTAGSVADSERSHHQLSFRSGSPVLSRGSTGQDTGSQRPHSQASDYQKLIASRSLSPLQEMSSSSSADPSKHLPNSQGSQRSILGMLDTLDTSGEKLRKASVSQSLAYDELPSIRGTYNPGDPLPTQEDLLNISPQAAKRRVGQIQQNAARCLFSQTGSPEKGRVFTPEKLSSRSSSSTEAGLSETNEPAEDKRMSSEKPLDVSTERYEKVTSPNRALLERPQAKSWRHADELAFSSQHMSPPREPLPRERCASMASTQTDLDTLSELSGRLVEALNKEDELKSNRKGKVELHKQYEQSLRELERLQSENEELKSRVATLQADELQADELQSVLAQKEAVIRRLEENERMSEGRLSQLNRELSRSKSEVNSTTTKLESLSEELKLANQRASEANRKFRETAQQLRDEKNNSLRHKLDSEDLQARLGDMSQELRSLQQQLHAAQQQLRSSTEALIMKTKRESELGADLEQANDERASLIKQLDNLRSQFPTTTGSKSTAAGQQQKLDPDAAQPSYSLHSQQQQVSPPNLSSVEFREEYQPRFNGSARGDNPRTSTPHYPAHQLKSDKQMQESTNNSTETHYRRGNSQAAKPINVRQLRQEMRSILDSSQQMQADIACALEQTLDATRAAAGDQADATQTNADLYSLLKLNLDRVNELNERLEELNSRAPELLEHSHRRSNSSHHSDISDGNSPKRQPASSSYQQTSPSYHQHQYPNHQQNHQQQHNYQQQNHSEHSDSHTQEPHNATRASNLNRSQNNAMHPHSLTSYLSPPGETRSGRGDNTHMHLSQAAARSNNSPYNPNPQLYSAQHNQGRYLSPTRQPEVYGNVDQLYDNRGSYHEPSRSHSAHPYHDQTAADDFTVSMNGLHHGSDRLAGLSYDLPSTRSPLYAVSDLINYEMLKKQNEESLRLLSTLEASTQNKLDKFTTASPLESSEWCTLRELKGLSEDLKKTLFSEKKHITKFFIREIPEGKYQSHEELMRAYKKMESRYDWAKTQLMELMRVTKSEDDINLLAQMRKIRSILQSSKENFKTRKLNLDKLRKLQQRPSSAMQ